MLPDLHSDQAPRWCPSTGIGNFTRDLGETKTISGGRNAWSLDVHAGGLRALASAGAAQGTAQPPDSLAQAPPTFRSVASHMPRATFRQRV